MTTVEDLVAYPRFTWTPGLYAYWKSRKYPLVVVDEAARCDVDIFCEGGTPAPVILVPVYSITSASRYTLNAKNIFLDIFHPATKGILLGLLQRECATVAYAHTVQEEKVTVIYTDTEVRSKKFLGESAIADALLHVWRAKDAVPPTITKPRKKKKAPKTP